VEVCVLRKIVTDVGRFYEKLVFDEYIFLTMKQAGTYVVKLLIAFIGVITESIMSQHPEIVRRDELQIKKGVYLTFDYRLFVGPHDLNIVMFIFFVSKSNGFLCPCG